MKGAVIVDTNLMVLLVVGALEPDLIARHKRLQGYSTDDFEMVSLIVAGFADIITLPHILAETSTLISRTERGALRTIVEGSIEILASSLEGCARNEFADLGLTDSMIVHICSLEADGVSPTLLTADTALANAAASLGCNVINYEQDYRSP